MNWGLIFGQFAYGFVRCLELSRAERRQLNAGFNECIQVLSQQSGIPVVGLTEHRATFQVPSQGRTYPVVVLNENPLKIGACSCITWRRGTVPPGLLEALSRQNRLLNNMAFDLIEGANESFIIIEAKLSPAEFTLEAFQAVLNELMPRIVTLDEWLSDHGFVE